MEVYITYRPENYFDEYFNEIKYLYDSGIRNTRINFSKYTNQNSIEFACDCIRRIQKIYPDLKIMADFPYPNKKPRLHLDVLKIDITKNELYCLSKKLVDFPEGKNLRIDYLSEKIQKGDILYYGDGEGAFIVEEKKTDHYMIRALNSFCIYDTKPISAQIITNTSYENVISYVVQQIQPEEVALSLVEGISDLQYVRLLQNTFHFNIISKIETDKAVINGKEIVENSDGIMVARGDLGLYADWSSLLDNQNNMIKLAQELHKKCYIATDILNSLSDRYLPSRADIIDITLITRSGVDGVILNRNFIESKNVEKAIAVLSYNR